MLCFYFRLDDQSPLSAQLPWVYAQQARHLQRQSPEAEIIVRKFLNGTGIHNTSSSRPKDADCSPVDRLILYVRVIGQPKQVERVENEGKSRPLKMSA